MGAGPPPSCRACRRARPPPRIGPAQPGGRPVLGGYQGDGTPCGCWLAKNPAGWAATLVHAVPGPAAGGRRQRPGGRRPRPTSWLWDVGLRARWASVRWWASGDHAADVGGSAEATPTWPHHTETEPAGRPRAVAGRRGRRRRQTTPPSTPCSSSWAPGAEGHRAARRNGCTDGADHTMDDRTRRSRSACLLPDVLGTYSDSGNATVLAQRLRLARAITAEILRCTAGQAPPTAWRHLPARRRRGHRAAVRGPAGCAATAPLCRAMEEGGCVTLAVVRRACRSSGTRWPTAPAASPPASALPRHHHATEAAPRPSATSSPSASCPGVGQLCGFENHRGRDPRLGRDARPARPRSSSGVGKRQPAVRPRQATEGRALSDRIIGTYLHGPRNWPRNPRAGRPHPPPGRPAPSCRRWSSPTRQRYGIRYL